MARVPPALVERTARLAAALPKRWHVRNPSDKFTKVGRVLAADGAEDAYLALVSHWDDPGVRRQPAPPTSSPSPRDRSRGPSSAG